MIVKPSNKNTYRLLSYTSLIYLSKCGQLVMDRIVISLNYYKEYEIMESEKKCEVEKSLSLQIKHTFISKFVLLYKDKSNQY